MTKLILFICVIVSFILTMLVGNYLYKVENKKAFNYLNVFPFEMESKKDPKLTMFFRILLAIFISFSCVDILILLIFQMNSNFNSRFLGGILILESMMLLGTFLISTKSYKGHIFVSSVFFGLNFISYILLGYNSLLNGKPLVISIISFIIGFILLIIMLSPLLKDWFKLDKREENEEIITSRKKVNLYVINEWSNVILFIINLLINTILFYL